MMLLPSWRRARRRLESLAGARKERCFDDAFVASIDRRRRTRVAPLHPLLRDVLGIPARVDDETLLDTWVQMMTTALADHAHA